MAHTGDSILILDFGSQYTQLIARRVRELGVYAEILPGNVKFAEIAAFDPTAIILSGSPFSVYAEDAPQSAEEIFSMGKPILGICYGIQMLAHRMVAKLRRVISVSLAAQRSRSSIAIHDC